MVHTLHIYIYIVKDKYTVTIKRIAFMKISKYFKYFNLFHGGVPWPDLSISFSIWESKSLKHHNYVIMNAMAYQITSLTIVYSTVYSDADQRKHQSSASMAFVRGIHRGPVNSLHKWPVTRKMFPFDDVIMENWGLKIRSVFCPP